jgi:hypothetical protein
MLKRAFYLLLLSVVGTSAWGQAEVDKVNREELEEQYNPNSLNPIPSTSNFTSCVFGEQLICLRNRIKDSFPTMDKSPN